MAKSKTGEVCFSITDAWLGGRDLRIDLPSQLGTLLVSGHSLAWFVQGHKEGEELTWDEFSALIQEHGKLCHWNDRRA